MIIVNNKGILTISKEKILETSFISRLPFPNKYKKLIAFTLAEILITLLIIGVVVSLTIPSIITNTQNAEYKTAWKKVFADVNQATKRIMVDNGGTLNGVCGLDGSSAQDNCLRNEYAKYLNVIDTCDADASEKNNCWYVTAKFLYGGTSSPYNDGSALKLSNGTLISIVWWPIDPAGSPWGTGCQTDWLVKDVCGLLYIDVNGNKLPNQFGKDLYGVWITKKGIIPRGQQGDWSDSHRTGPGGSGCDLLVDPQAKGMTCAADYLK